VATAHTPCVEVKNAKPRVIGGQGVAHGGDEDEALCMLQYSRVCHRPHNPNPRMHNRRKPNTRQFNNGIPCADKR
jgi:hypothetical protein